MDGFVKLGVLGALPFLAYAVVAFAMPAWVKESPASKGNKFIIVCAGEGPAIDLARREALDSCRAAAVEQLKSKFHVRSLTVQTEKDSAHHLEVSSDQNYEGLSCNQLKQQIEDRKDRYKVWLQCEFDLSKAKVSANKEKKTQRHIASGERRELSVATVPDCDSILLEGFRARTVRCNQNPMPVILYPEDESLTIRAEGYQPKTIELSTNRSVHQSIQIILQPMR